MQRYAKYIILLCIFLAASAIMAFLQAPAYIATLCVQDVERQEAQQNTQYLLRALDKMSRHHIAEPRTMVVTAFTAGPESTGKHPGHPAYGLTASGYRLTDADSWRVAAADSDYWPAGTRLNVPGVGVVTVVDTGADVRGPGRLDIFVGMSDVSAAREFGRQTKQVLIQR